VPVVVAQHVRPRQGVDEPAADLAVAVVGRSHLLAGRLRDADQSLSA
jgi:hypothetical protein